MALARGVVPLVRERSSFLSRQKGTKNRLRNLRFLRISLALYCDCQCEPRRTLSGDKVTRAGARNHPLGRHCIKKKASRERAKEILKNHGFLSRLFASFFLGGKKEIRVGTRNKPFGRHCVSEKAKKNLASAAAKRPPPF